MAAEACGGSRDEALPAACAVEMVHTYSLIHDDLPAMDDDDLRRGQPSCHAAFGEGSAILAGDGLLTYAFEVLARDVRPAATAARCCAELARAAGPEAMVGGQADDLAAQGNGGTLEQLESIHARKTGAMFVASLRLGGLVGRADARQMESLTEYGRALGLAFQIIDDLLDLTGDSATVGKNTGKDDRQGKLTFPGLLGVDESRRRSAELIGRAQEALAVFAELGEPLRSLARYVLERNR